MHYVLHLWFTGTTNYFCCKQDLLVWIDAHKHLLNKNTKLLINVYRCPFGFKWYIKHSGTNYIPNPDYLLGNIGQFINSL